MAYVMVGELLRRHRLELGLTQKVIADKVGYDNTVVSRIERGELLPSEEFVTRFVDGLSLPDAEADEIWGVYRRTKEPGANIETKRPFLTDWGEAPDVRVFYGRYEELTTLAKWLADDDCRLVSVLGMGGIGKTALAAKVAKQTAVSFDYMIWRSLRNAPPLDEILTELLQLLSNQQEVELPHDSEKAITKIIGYLSKHQCLLVLDNVESIMREGHAGDYREEYWEYGRFFQRVGESDHKSHLLLTSREKPKEIGYLEGDAYPVRVMQLAGLEAVEGQQVLAAKSLSGSELAVQSLVSHYSGNPLALNLVAEMIREVYGGHIDAFLEDDEVIFGRIGDVIGEQFARLSPLEQSLMYWLAIEREPVSRNILLKNLVIPVTKRELMIALRSLRRRSLVEMNDATFTLQNVVMEFVTDRLIENIYEEIITGTVNLLNRHALMKATAKAYVRDSQIRLLVKPIADKLLHITSQLKVAEMLMSFIATVRESESTRPGYLGGNVLNLLLFMGADLTGYDFSSLTIRQAFLQESELHDVNFADTDLSTSVLRMPFSAIHSLAFNATGDLLAIGTSREIQVWHWDTEQMLFHRDGHKGHVRSVAFSPNGQLLANGTGAYSVCLWDFRENKLLTNWKEHQARVRTVCFHPDGQMLASGSDDHTIRIWHIWEKQSLCVLAGHTSNVNALAFSPDSQILVSGSSDNTVRLWNIDSGKCIEVLSGHTNLIRSVCFSPDGKLIASAGADKTINIWDVNTLRCIGSFLGHSGQIRSLEFSSDGNLLASAGHDQTVRVMDITKAECINILRGHTDIITALSFHPDSHILVSGSIDHTVRVWDAAKGQCISNVNGYASIVRTLCFGTNSQHLVSASRKTIYLWNVGSGTVIRQFKGHNTTIWGVALSPDARILASGSDDGVRLWDVETGEIIKDIDGRPSIYSLAFSPDGCLLALASAHYVVQVWNIKTNDEPLLLQRHRHRIRAVSFHPNGHIIASGNENGDVILWDVKTGTCLFSVKGHDSSVRDVSFNFDGSILASCSDDETIRLWDPKTGDCLRIIEEHSGRIASIAFCPHENILVSGNHDNTIRVWDSVSGECLKVLTGHRNRVVVVAFSSNGKYVASGSYDETIRLWDIETGECVQVLRSKRPYEGMNITGVAGISSAQKASLIALGAVDRENV